MTGWVFVCGEIRTLGSEETRPSRTGLSDSASGGIGSGSTVVASSQPDQFGLKLRDPGLGELAQLVRGLAARPADEALVRLARRHVGHRHLDVVRGVVLVEVRAEASQHHLRPRLGEVDIHDRGPVLADAQALSAGLVGLQFLDPLAELLVLAAEAGEFVGSVRHRPSRSPGPTSPDASAAYPNRAAATRPARSRHQA